MVGPGSVCWATKILQDVWHRQRKGRGIPELCGLGTLYPETKDLFILPFDLLKAIAWSGARDRGSQFHGKERCHQVILNVVSSPRQDAARPHLGGLNRVLRGPPENAGLSEV